MVLRSIPFKPSFGDKKFPQDANNRVREKKVPWNRHLLFEICIRLLEYVKNLSV